MQHRQILKQTLFTLWLLLVALVIAGIYFQDRFFAAKALPIARLDQKEGSVVVRSEGVIRWRDVAPKQEIYDGDLLATGQDARVRVSLGPGRSLNVAEETQVKITAIATTGRDFPFLIKLIRGTAAAEIDAGCKSCSPIIVRAGDETFRVASGKQVGITKEAGNKPAKTFQPARNAPLVSLLPRAVAPSVQLTRNFVETVQAPPPPPPPAPPPPPPPPPPPAPIQATPPALRAAGSEVQLMAPSEGLEYWSLEPPAVFSKVVLTYSIRPPQQRALQGDWRPLVGLSGAAEEARPVPLPVTATDQSVALTLGAALAVATTDQRSGVKEYSFRLRGGSEVSREKDKMQSFTNKGLLTKVFSLGEVADGPISIGLDALTTTTTTAAVASSPWLSAKQATELKNANIIIHLVTSKDYPKFHGFIRACRQFGSARSGLAGNNGIFVVKDQSVVAQLAGPGIDKKVMDTVMNALQADFVFRGERSALHDARGSSKTALVDLVGALLNKGQILYILKRNKLYPVSRDFIKTSSEVASFIDTQAKAIFLEKVDIVDYR